MRIIASLIITFCVLQLGLAANADPLVTKDGRQYMLELKRRLNIDSSTELESAFQDLRQNLPKQNSYSSMTSSMDAVAKMAAAACTYVGYFNAEWNDLAGLYQMMLDRPPTESEVTTAIRDSSGKLKFFPNCFMLALHPEFLKRK